MGSLIVTAFWCYLGMINEIMHLKNGEQREKKQISYADE
jgi:hypothetical protein